VKNGYHYARPASINFICFYQVDALDDAEDAEEEESEDSDGYTNTYHQAPRVALIHRLGRLEITNTTAGHFQRMNYIK